MAQRTPTPHAGRPSGCQREREDGRGIAEAVRASVQAKAVEATAAYVQLLGLSQLGLANRLPGGDATGSTVQSGSYLINVAGSERRPG